MQRLLQGPCLYFRGAFTLFSSVGIGVKFRKLKASRPYIRVERSQVPHISVSRDLILHIVQSLKTMVLNAFQTVFLAISSYVLWRLLRPIVVQSQLSNIPGPPNPSWFKGKGFLKFFSSLTYSPPISHAPQDISASCSM